jgi:hypothetical protein
MTGSLLSYLVAFLMLLAGNRDRTDLLDALSTDVYWQIKHVTPDVAQLERDAGFDPAPASIETQLKDLGATDFATRDKARQELERMGPTILPLLQPATASPDAEVAAVAQDLVKKFSERGQERAIRRLMAIRTLGERKEKAALPLLNTLKDSQVLFVGDYARRSIAQINGEKYVPADLSDKLAGDVGLMPAEAALVGQSSGLNTQPLTIAAVVEAALANDARGDMPLMPGAAGPGKPDAKALERRVSGQLLALLERVGNLRMDAVTAGFNYLKNDAGEQGWFAVVIRGQYDAGLMVPALRGMIGGDAVITPAEKPGDVTVVAQKNGEAIILLPNNEQLIFITAPDEKSGQAVREGFLAALKAGHGKLGDNQELAALMKTVDRKSPLWLACRFTDALDQQTGHNGFKTLTVQTKAVKDGTEFTFQAEMADADKAKVLAESMTAGLKSAQEEVKQEAAARAALKPVAEMLGTVKVSAEGAGGTMTGRLPAGILNTIIGELPLMEMLAPPDVGPAVDVQPAPGGERPMPEGIAPDPAPLK